MADSKVEEFEQAVERVQELASEVNSVERMDAKRKLGLDLASYDYSHYPLLENDEPVAPVDAATHNNPRPHTVSDEQYEQFSNGELTRDELLAPDDAYITTRKKYTGVIVSLFTPRPRAVLVDTFTRIQGGAKTVAELAEHSSELTVEDVEAQIDPLLELGFIVEAGEKDGETQYDLNGKHPLTQVVSMVDSIGRFGRTNLFVERDFLVPGPNGETLGHDEQGHNDSQ